MNTNPRISRIIRRAGGLGAGVLLLAGAFAAEKAETDALPKFESYIKITGQAASISGNDKSYQSRVQQPANGGAGVEDLHIFKEVSKATSYVIEGKALTGTEDYLGSFKVTKNEVGTFDVGYKRFRTFYDGVGGFFPTNRQWMPLADEGLHVDRSKFWIEGKVAMPNQPELALRYTNELRTGRKDSLIWGDTDLTGLAFNLAPNPISPARKIVPSYIQLSEHHQRLEATVEHKINQTHVSLMVFGDQTNNLDNRFVTRFPGEVIPFAIVSLSTTIPAGQVAAPQNIAKAAAPATNWNNEVKIMETDGMKTKTSGVTLESDTRLNPQFTLKLNGNYELIHTDAIGNRPLVTSTATATGVVPVTTNNYSNLQGGTRLKNYVGTVGLDWKPTRDWLMKFALRTQDEFIRGSSTYDVIAASGTPATTLASTPRIGWASIHQNVHTPVFEFRYTGIKDLSIYGNGNKRDLSGVERNTSAFNYLTATAGTLANNNVSEDHENYTLGANWKTSSLLTLRGEVFHKGHKDGTDGFGVSVGDHYLLDSSYTGFKLTALARPSPFVGFQTRYVHQVGRMDVTGFLPTYPATRSLDARNHIISENIDWTPHKGFYAQVNGSVIFNVINTVYPRAGVTPAVVNATGLVTANAFDTNRVLQNSNNNYVTAGVLTGWTVDRVTDAQVQCNYYRANNGNPVLAALTLPYGVAVKDVTVALTLKRKFSDKWIGTAKVGYFDSRNDTTGGFTNYRGPLAYLSFEYAL